MRRYLTGVGIAILWVAFIALAWFMSQQSSAGLADFRVYYDAAHLLAAGEPLYQGIEGMGYLYPPLMAQLLMPLALNASFAVTYAVWFVFNTLLLIGTTAILSRHTRRRYWLWLVTPLFMPALQAIAIGQVTVLLLTLFAGAWLAVEQDQRGLAGILLALAAWIKVFPAFVIVYFLWQRDWRVVRGALIGGVSFGIVQIVISGLTPMIDLLDVLMSLSGSGQDRLVAVNASLVGFTSQLFQAHPNVTPLIVSPVLYTISRAALTLLLVGGLLYLTRPRRPVDFDLGYALAVMTALLLSPTLFPMSMPPVLLTYFLLVRRRPTLRMLWFCTFAIVGLSIYWLYVLGYANDWRVSGLLLSFGFYVLVMTWGVNAFLLFRQITVQPENLLVGEARG